MTFHSDLVDKFANEVLESVNTSDTALDTEHLSKHLTVIENLCTAGSKKMSSLVQSDADQLKKELSHLKKSYKEADTEGMLHSVHLAEKGRVHKLEHEAMAKLVNKLQSKSELEAESSSAIESIANLSHQALVLDRQTEIRKMAASVLSQLIPSIQASLLVDPKDEDLPPLTAVDPAFILE